MRNSDKKLKKQYLIDGGRETTQKELTVWTIQNLRHHYLLGADTS